MFNLQKESTALTKKLAPPGARRRSTLGFVNQMMFTKRIGAAWKNAVKSRTKGEDLKKLVETMQRKRDGLKRELAKAEESLRSKQLTVQQMEIQEVRSGKERSDEALRMSLRLQANYM
jgi:seryl-tRNA synthetase